MRFHAISGLVGLCLVACGGSDESGRAESGGSSGSGGTAGAGATGGTAGASGAGTGGAAGSGGDAGTGNAGSGGDAGSTSTGGTGTGGTGTGGTGTGGTGNVGGGGAGGAPTQCWQDKFGPGKPNTIDYTEPDPDPVLGSHCLGTNHQDIQGVERVVYLGDSITVGTPPTPVAQFYASQVSAGLQQKFGAIPGQNCAEWGARVDDFATQIPKCFTFPETRKTLIVTTMGGNDLANMAKDKKDLPTSIAQSDQVISTLRDTLATLTDPTNFPNGSYVVFANVYEFTDTTGVLSSCPLAGVAGFSGTWTIGADVLRHLNSGYLQAAVDSRTDMIFLFENFCGHGFKAGDVNNQCYQAADHATWFDLTCIHPTPVGHTHLAQQVLAVVNE